MFLHLFLRFVLTATSFYENHIDHGPDDSNYEDGDGDDDDAHELCVLIATSFNENHSQSGLSSV